ncbi:HAD family hydrolase [Tenacibaculum aiptasiae]|nr:HAD family hydrolase [Tenacibaculum aiptasiae]
MNTIKTMVFDLYNTLIEIKKPNHFFLKLFKISKNGFDIDFSSYLKLVMTKDINQLKSVLPIEFNQLYNKNIASLEEELNSVIVYEEVFDVLESLKQNFRIFLISNLASPYKHPFYEYNLDSYFEEMLFSCDIGYLKPDRFIFNEIEKLTNNTPNEILMIGDSFKSDILGAKKMNWNYLKVNRHSSSLKDYEITNLKEIEQHIKI